MDRSYSFIFFNYFGNYELQLLKKKHDQTFVDSNYNNFYIFFITLDFIITFFGDYIIGSNNSSSHSSTIYLNYLEDKNVTKQIPWRSKLKFITYYVIDIMNPTYYIYLIEIISKVC